MATGSAPPWPALSPIPPVPAAPSREGKAGSNRLRCVDMLVRFQIVSPASKRRSVSVRLPILLGRGAEAKFKIQHDLVSRRHCELFEREGIVYVRDLGSTNGTFLNDEQVAASTKTEVPAGSTVRVGGLSFVVEYERPRSARDDSPAPLQPVPGATPTEQSLAVAEKIGRAHV